MAVACDDALASRPFVHHPFVRLTPPPSRALCSPGDRNAVFGNSGIGIEAVGNGNVIENNDVGGCASVQPAKGTPIASIDRIAGKWVGTISPGPQLVATWGGNTAWGTVSLRGGRARFEMEPPLLEGSIVLYDDGRRSLVLNELWATFAAQVRPQR